MDTTIEKRHSTRIRTTTVMTADERKLGEEQALKTLAKRVNIRGFRAGSAPPDLVRQHVKPKDVMEEAVRALLPKVVAEALKLSGAKPIIRPSVSVTALDPLTITVTFVERPAAELRKPENINVEKKPMLTGHQRNAEMKRREEELYGKVREATKIDVAPELIDAEVQEMLSDLQYRLKEQESTVEKWLEATGKKWEQVIEEMKAIAKDRIVLRFGMQLLADCKKAEADPQVLEQAIAAERAHSKDHGRDIPPSELQPGGTVYEQIRWEKRMQKLVEGIIMDA
jgi:FKBP-type peptidyl-prolyl cis-trans isomerase (trigger factor)